VARRIRQQPEVLSSVCIAPRLYKPKALIYQKLSAPIKKPRLNGPGPLGCQTSWYCHLLSQSRVFLPALVGRALNTVNPGDVTKTHGGATTTCASAAMAIAITHYRPMATRFVNCERTIRASIFETDPGPDPPRLTLIGEDLGTRFRSFRLWLGCILHRRAPSSGREHRPHARSGVCGPCSAFRPWWRTAGAGNRCTRGPGASGGLRPHLW